MTYKTEHKEEVMNELTTELLQALEGLQAAIHEYGLLDVRKRFSLCTASAQAGTAIHKAKVLQEHPPIVYDGERAGNREERE